MFDGFYCFEVKSATCLNPRSAPRAKNANLCHQRMLNLQHDGSRWTVKIKVKEDVTLNETLGKLRFIVCVYAKSSRCTFSRKGGACTKSVLEIVGTEVCGSFPVEALGESRYFVWLFDDYFKFAWIYFIKSKSNIFCEFSTWLALAENQYGHGLKKFEKGCIWIVLQSDNEWDNFSHKMTQTIEQQSFRNRLASHDNSPQNRIAERINLALVQFVRWMLL